MDLKHSYIDWVSINDLKINGCSFTQENDNYSLDKDEGVILDNVSLHYPEKNMNIADGIVSSTRGALLGTSIEDLVINGGYEFEFAAFAGCENLKSVAIGDGVASIADCSFDCCSGLSEITLPDSLKYLGMYAFASCESLTEVKLPENLLVIDSCAFANCDNLKHIALPQNLEKIGEGVFKDCDKLEMVIAPSRFVNQISKEYPNVVVATLEDMTLYKYSPNSEVAYNSVLNGSIRQQEAEHIQFVADASRTATMTGREMKELSLDDIINEKKAIIERGDLYSAHAINSSKNIESMIEI